MGDKTKIEWTDASWNPTRGCSKVSAGCRNCYAETVAARFCGEGAPYEGTIQGRKWNGHVRLEPAQLYQPLRWQRPRRIFVNSMSDIFHESIPDEYILAVFGAMSAARHHCFQLLTKRPARASEWFQWASAQWPGRSHWKVGDKYVDDVLFTALESAASAQAAPSRMRKVVARNDWPLPNVWVGVSVEDQASADERVPQLLNLPAAVRWLSMEPLLSAVNVEQWLGVVHEDDAGTHNQNQDLPDALGVPFHDPWVAGVDWVVVGGESGRNARPMHPQWARELRDQCARSRVSFFFKQWGAWVPFGDDHFDTSSVGDDVEAMDRVRWLAPDGRWCDIKSNHDEAAPMLLAGKKTAGRVLDGRTHDEWPRESNA